MNDELKNYRVEASTCNNVQSISVQAKNTIEAIDNV